ncbi:MAG: DNA mismatch repair protein MutS [Bacteroidales bacterium]|nr:DNA mismatch repair protein MutS [Bacteroidales bacterium]
MFDHKKKTKERLLESFGKLKDESYNFEMVEKYFRKKDKTDALQVLSDKTCNDLDFHELFMFLDRTTSRVGQQYLYNTLRTIPKNGDKFILQEKLINKISSDSNLRLNLQLHLYKLARDNTYFITSLFQDEHTKPPKWFFIIRLLSLTSLLSILTLPFIPQSFFVLLVVFIINMGIHYWNKRNLYEYLGSIPQLLKLNDVAKELIKYDIFTEISQDLPDSIRIIDKVRNRMSFFKMETKLESDAEIAFLGIFELFKSLFLLEPLLLFGVLKQLDTKRREIENVFAFVGYVDSLISIASLRQGLSIFCIPEVENKSKILKAVEMYHPLIINCISNSIQVNHKSILLTGSNMSGKTSFIRTIGINALTGLTINTCFAEQFCLSILKIFSAIRISDDLMNDKSYYFQEVLTIKEMIEKSQIQGSNLFLLDEIFKGTNTIERISAGKAVLSYLNNDSNIVFVSTHDIELADMLDDTYELYHFSEQVDNKTVAFDFKLKDGKLINRNAIRILEINDYPEKIITEAIELSKELDKFSLANKM